MSNESARSDAARDFGEDVERAKAIAESNNPTEDMQEFVRYTNQGATFRIVARPVSGLQAVYIEKKSNGEWQHEKKLGWQSTEVQEE